MWAALRTDLKEFVTTVADEGTGVLEKLDSKLQEDGTANEVEDSMEHDEDVMIGEDGQVVYTGSRHHGSGDSSSNYERTGVVSTPADEAARRRESQDTYMEPLIPGGERVASKPPPPTTNTESSTEEEEESAPVTEDTISYAPEVMNDPFYDNVRDYITTFDIESRTDEISDILMRHPETVHEYFETLVPTEISYELFWMRYFYRCNVDRIAQEWQEERERARLAREKAISEGISSVKNLFGGAVKAVSQTVGVRGTETPPNSASVGSAYEKVQAELQQKKQGSSSTGGGGIASSLFGAGGRPPFVMNTAVSDADSASYHASYHGEEEEDEDEEEEELGWDDDEDDDYETDEEAEEEDDGEEEIAFSSPARMSGDTKVEELELQLEQAQNESLELNEKLKSQMKEIVALREGAGGVEDNSDEKEKQKEMIDKLKMTIFEKDSELGALRASLEDTHDEERNASTKKNGAKIAAQERELERLSTEMSAKDAEIVRLTTEVEEKSLAAAAAASTKQLEDISVQANVEPLEEALEEAQVLIGKLNVDVQTANAAADESAAEIKALREQLASLESHASSDVMAAQNELTEAHTQIESLQAECKDTKNSVDLATRRGDDLATELERTREKMAEQGATFATQLEEEVAKVRAEYATPTDTAAPAGEESDSSSTGVQVPSNPVAIALVNEPSDNDDDDEDDDWGDGWGDED
eukprot:CAMPEP_0198282950 /NCGR_PEP_ID=MMETSP1449-20131203/2642_1 /TAXON_ID=420275 /ORGANISM="Attheya septentrionalis, Strain CCMP2084" /LENGTH=702 /DNA_ID=CAMNT_0043979371 /DNA_START=107 /DNA_END=2215 /DNA_ORIENTATION=+